MPPKHPISRAYGRESFDLSDNRITVTIPFSFINQVGDEVGDKTLPPSAAMVLADITSNPSITKPDFMKRAWILD